MKKLVKRFVGMVLLCAMATTTVMAAPSEAAKNEMTNHPLKYLYWSTTQDVDTEGNSVKIVLNEKQLKILDGISYDVEGVEATNDGITVRLKKLFGDRNLGYALLEVTANDGRIMDGDAYSFWGVNPLAPEWRDKPIPLSMYISRPSNVDEALGPYICSIRDENPNDNKILIMMYYSDAKFMDENISLIGETVKFKLRNLVRCDGKTRNDAIDTIVGEGSEHIMAELIAEGDWTFSVPLNYPDKIKEYKIQKSFDEQVGSKKIKVFIDTVKISPVAVTFTGSRESQQRNNAKVSLKKKDGTIINARHNRSYGNSDTQTIFNYIITDPVDIDNVDKELKSIIIAGQEFPLK